MSLSIDLIGDSLTWVNLLLLSLFIVLARRRARTFANPVTFGAIIHFFHNWSYDLATRFSNVGLIIPYTPSPGAIIEVKLTNTLGTFFLLAPLLFFLQPPVREPEKEGRISPVIPQVLEFLYLVTLPFPFIFETGLSSLTGQALTSLEAFNPVGVLLVARSFLIINAAAYRVYYNVGGRIWSFLCALSVEGLFMMLFGWRKVFMIILCALLVMGLIRWGLPKRRTIIAVSIFAALTLIIGQFVADTRHTRGDTPWRQTIGDYFSYMTSTPLEWIGQSLTVASSEGVQYWACDIWSDDSMKYMTGRTYAQAVINTVVPRLYQGDIRDWQGAYAFKYVAYAHVVDMGYDFSFSAEAIINWGPYFSWISFLALGLSFGITWRNRWKSIWWFNFSALLFSVSVIALRTDSVSYLRFLFVGTVPFVLCSILAVPFGLTRKAVTNVQLR